jgi:hypothetical protein
MVPKSINTRREILIKIEVGSREIVASLRIEAFETGESLIKTDENQTTTARDTRNLCEFVVWNVLKNITPKNLELVPTSALPCHKCEGRCVDTTVLVRSPVKQKIGVRNCVSPESRR